MYRMDPPDLINSNFKENSHSLLRIKADMLIEPPYRNIR